MNEGFELIEREANLTGDIGREFRVSCDEEYSEAGEYVVNCKRLIAKVKDEFREPKRLADEAHKSICAMETRVLKPIQEGMGIAGANALSWKREQDRLAREEADRIDAEKKRADEEVRLKEAERLEAEGRSEEAEKILDAPPPPASRPTKFVSPAPRVDGLSTKKSWKARIVAPDLVTRSYCLPDQTTINRKVQAFFKYNEKPTAHQIEDLEATIGGVEIYEDEIFAGRMAR